MFFFDFAVTKQISFQDPAAPLFEGIINLHHTVFFYLVIILLLVLTISHTIYLRTSLFWERPSYTTLSIFRHFYFNLTNLKHGTFLEIFWTIVPTFILISIVIPSFALLYSIDEIINPTVTIKVIGHQWYWTYEFSSLKPNSPWLSLKSKGIFYTPPIINPDEFVDVFVKETMNTPISFESVFEMMKPRIIAASQPLMNKTNLHLLSINLYFQGPFQPKTFEVKAVNAIDTWFKIPQGVVKLTPNMEVVKPQFGKMEHDPLAPSTPETYYPYFLDLLNGDEVRARFYADWMHVDKTKQATGEEFKAYYNFVKEKSGGDPDAVQANELTRLQEFARDHRDLREKLTDLEKKALKLPDMSLFHDAHEVLLYGSKSEMQEFFDEYSDKMVPTLKFLFIKQIFIEQVKADIATWNLMSGVGLIDTLKRGISSILPVIFDTSRDTHDLIVTARIRFTPSELPEPPDLDNNLVNSYMKPLSSLNKGDLRLLEVDHPIVCPIKSHLRFIITSTDVIHSWAVPSLAIKVDAVPGRLNQAHVFIDRQGVFYGQCSELCGINHAFMPIKIIGI